MKRRGEYRGLIVVLAVGVGVLCVGCKTKTVSQQPISGTASEGNEKCRIDIPISGAQDVVCDDFEKGRDDRIIWQNRDTNSSRKGLYVCADNPSHSVFDAYAWYVHKGEDAKSGKIRHDFKPDFPPTEDFSYYVSKSPCDQRSGLEEGESSSLEIRTHPKIIIKASE